jgi:hypothetical protein
MIPIPSGVRVWIATGHTDMRRGMNSLVLLVQEAFKRAPAWWRPLRVRGKSGKLIKILWHDGLGMRRRPPAHSLPALEMLADAPVHADLARESARAKRDA